MSLSREQQTRIKNADMEMGRVNISVAEPADPLPLRVPRPQHIRLGYRAGDVRIERHFVREEEVRPSAGLLEAFIDLAEATDEQILDFTCEWGTLHEDFDFLEDEVDSEKDFDMDVETVFEGGLSEAFANGVDLGSTRRRGREDCIWYATPTSEYREKARQFRAIILLAADFLSGKPSQMEDWNGALRVGKAVGRADLIRRHGVTKARLQASERLIWSKLVSDLLHQAMELPVVIWNKSAGPQITLNGLPVSANEISSADIPVADGFVDEWDIFENVMWNFRARRSSVPPNAQLFTALTYQMVASVTSRHGVYRCDNCGKPFSSDRRLRADRKRFCGRSCSNEGHREVERRSYRKRNPPKSP